jgi:hypothetical protein
VGDKVGIVHVPKKGGVETYQRRGREREINKEREKEREYWLGQNTRAEGKEQMEVYTET